MGRTVLMIQTRYFRNFFMKRLLLFAINLLSSVSPTFGYLDEPLIELYQDKEKTMFRGKDLRPKSKDPRSSDERYKGRSAINNMNYPKMPMIHPYNHCAMSSPFSTVLPQARPSQALKHILAHQLPDHQVIYSFCIQGLTPNLDLAPNALGPGSLGESSNDPFALKPHYLVHPDAPFAHRGKDYKTSLKWTVMPGIAGRVAPASGGLGLHSDDVHTHSSNPKIPGARMGVSADVMHLKGIEKVYIPERFHHFLSQHHDLYSLVAYTDEKTGKKIAAVTYHWLLTGRDYDAQEKFWDVLEQATTFRELIVGRPGEFAGLEAQAPFHNLVGELKRYVDFSPQKVAPKVPVQAPQKPAVKKPIPQQKALPLPKQKPALKPAPATAKPAPVRKAAPSPRPAVVRKPVAQSKAQALKAKVTRVRMNVKAVPVRKAAPAPQPAVVRKPVGKAPTPIKKPAPVRAKGNTVFKKSVGPAKKALNPAAKKLGVMVKKNLATKPAPKKPTVRKPAPKKAPVHKTGTVRTKAGRSLIKK